MKVLKLGIPVLVGFLLLAQLFRIDKSNPPVTGDVSALPQVKSIMRRACYQCHSNEVVWPWYADVAPASWLVAYDVHAGRKDLNFSVWSTYSKEKQRHLLKEIADEIADGEMPPWYYVYPMHPEARLSATDQSAFEQWVASSAAVLR